MSENNEQGQQEQQQQGGAPAEQQGGKPGEQAKPEEGKGGKDAVLADLARERDKRQELETRLAQFEQSQKDQMSALAKAFGIENKEEAGATGVDVLTDQVKTIQDQLAASERKAAVLQAAANPGTDAAGNQLPAIPAEYHHLLENASPETLAEVAKSVGELVAVKVAQQQAPGFAQSAGQGNNNGGDTSLPAQIAAAEKELQGKTPGTADHKAAQRRLMSLKTQQLMATPASS